MDFLGRLVLIWLFVFASLANSSAGVGGPDAYGYTWIDSNEPNGPVYNWIDITGIGQQVNGLSDDNVVGPFPIASGFDFYWYTETELWIGSNGYIAFEQSTLAPSFDPIPTAGQGDNFIAPLLTDLNFAGSGNTGTCWFYDSPDTTIISWIDLPFWSASSPGYWGSNTFQVILSKTDSTIVFNYAAQSGTALTPTYRVGIENASGTIGLLKSDTLQAVNYAVRFINPSQPLITVYDAAINWNDNEQNGARILPYPSSAYPLQLNCANAGTEVLYNLDIETQVLDAANNVILQDFAMLDSLLSDADSVVIFGASFTPPSVGTLTVRSRVVPQPNEIDTFNNWLDFEFVVVDTTLANQSLSYHGGTGDGVGFAWGGAAGGIGYYFEPPNYPAEVVSTTYYLVGSGQNAPFSAKIYDDNGANGGPGTLLDSVYMDAIFQTLIDYNTIPVSQPVTINSGGIYVLFDAYGPELYLGVDTTPPFSYQTYEVLNGVWGRYRDRDEKDFLISVEIAHLNANGIADNAFIQVRAYPNPTSQFITLTAPDVHTYYIYDANGRLAMSGQTIPQKEFSLDVSQLPAGFYSMELAGENASYYCKFVKEN